MIQVVNNKRNKRKNNNSLFQLLINLKDNKTIIK